MSLQRGVILGPSGKALPDGTYHIESAVNPSLLRHYLLYFDRIHWAQNSFMQGAIPLAIRTLAKEDGIIDIRTTRWGPDGPEIARPLPDGQLFRTQYYGPPGRIGMVEMYQMAQAQSFIALSKDEPEIWTMGNYAEGWALPPELSEASTVLELRINAELPSPPANVNLLEILDFKARHSAELIAFRDCMDQLCASPELLANPIRTADRIQREIQDSVRAISARCSKSWRVRSKAITINQTITGKDIADTAIAAFGAGPIGHAATVASLVVASKFVFNIKNILRPSGLPNNVDRRYAYLVSAAKDFPGML